MSVGKLYIMEMSPPCRAVLLTAKALGIELEVMSISVLKGENKTPEFLKMNPAHSVPTYKDNSGVAMGDSHAIMGYLVDKYGGSNNPLYPSDIGVRAIINQRLHFDSGNVFSLHIAVMFPIMMKHESGPNDRQKEAADRMYEILDRFLDRNDWVAGTETYTIADFSLCTSIRALDVLIPMDATKYENITEWIVRCGQIPFYEEVNKQGEEMYTIMLNDLLQGKDGIVEKPED